MQKIVFNTLRKRTVHRIVAVLMVLLLSLLSELVWGLYERQVQLRSVSEVVSHASLLRARIERELNSLLFLSSGLSSYLKVRHDSLDDTEVLDILHTLYQNSRYVRNFGIAIGYRLTYVYPNEQNAQAMGLDYRDIPEQWPVIEAIVKRGEAVLDGPVNLVQGGGGLIYRMPIYIEGRYWGLLSTVLNQDQLVKALFTAEATQSFKFAVGAQSVHDLKPKPVYGDPTLFDKTDVILQRVEVPGGQWLLAVEPAQTHLHSEGALALRALGFILALVMAWLIYALLRSHAQLHKMALYDGLTGLPNRRLLEVRHEQLLTRIKRQPNQKHALLFLDLDGFKAINDHAGHKAGDAILQETAKRIQTLIRHNDAVFYNLEQRETTYDRLDFRLCG
ncbi:MAG: diguanylate cyclase [Methylococcales bacterium]|nr:diguanylate cyclase [Methylococcales bacterium]